MRTLNQTPLDDEQIIWIFKAKLDSGDVYLSTDDIQLTNFYDGKVTKITQHQETLEDGELSYSGGMSILGTLKIMISNSTDNTNFNDWFDSFYPNNAVYLINRFWEVGIVWEGANSDGQITWISELQCIDYGYGGESIELTLDANNEFANVNIPFYKTQSTYDDGISYIENLTTDEQGQVIPLVYGDYSTSWTLLPYNESVRKLAKAVLFDKSTLEYKYAFHPCYEDEPNDYVFKYISGNRNFLVMDASETNKINGYSGSSIQLNPDTRAFGDTTIGFTYFSNWTVGSRSDINDIKKLMNLDLDYLVIGVGETLGLKIDGNVSTSETGILNPLESNEFKFFIQAMSDSGVAGEVRMKYYSDRGVATGGLRTISASTILTHELALGTNTQQKPNQSLPWTMEEICSIEYLVQNTGSQPVRIYRAGVFVGDIKIQQFYGNRVKVQIQIRR